MTAVPHPLSAIAARSDRGLQRRRRLRLTRTRVRLSVQTRLLPTGSAGRRTRLRVCGAANTLTALGVRVSVVGPSIPWPRTRCVVVAAPLGHLGELAVTTVVRGEAICTATEIPDGATVCPVTVRYRLEGHNGHLPEGDVPSSPAHVAALQGLIVEVHLLPPTAPTA